MLFFYYMKNVHIYTLYYVSIHNSILNMLIINTYFILCYMNTLCKSIMNKIIFI